MYVIVFIFKFEKFSLPLKNVFDLRFAVFTLATFSFSFPDRLYSPAGLPERLRAGGADGAQCRFPGKFMLEGVRRRVGTSRGMAGRPGRLGSGERVVYFKLFTCTDIDKA